jgi:hypothetical protein
MPDIDIEKGDSTNMFTRKEKKNVKEVFCSTEKNLVGVRKKVVMFNDKSRDKV